MPNSNRAILTGATAAALLLTGCTGAGLPTIIAALLVFSVAIGVGACEDKVAPADVTSDVVDDTSDVVDDTSEVIDDTATACDGTWESACQDGAIVQLCCPDGMACNYGMTLVDCGDGTCVDYPAMCETEPECDGTWESACEDGAIVQLCCPTGMACNYGMTLVDCGDGTCVNDPETCETEPECDGTWESACEDGAIVQLCCPAGMACNYGMTLRDCGEGTCVNYPEECETEPVCDGTWESACEDGSIVQLCCPAGMACNYGMTLVDCGDGTCVDHPAKCETEPVCDGTWESACEDGSIVQLCCPAGMACNYGMTLRDCGEGTCVNYPEECEAEPVCDGTWESACQDGTIVQLCCPEGMACNYGMAMKDCGEGTCVDHPADCP